MEPSDLQNALLRLRFSTRDAALAVRYAAALRCAYADAFETVKLGRDAVAYAEPSMRWGMRRAKRARRGRWMRLGTRRGRLGSWASAGTR